MKKKIFTQLKDGFLFNINNSFDNIRFLEAKNISNTLLNEKDSYCVSFSDEMHDSKNADLLLLKYGTLENFDERRFTFEVIKGKNFDYLKALSGDFIVVGITDSQIIVYNSLESQNELFWSFQNTFLKASPFHYLVNNEIDYDALAPFCYGEGVNFFKNIKILKRGQLLILEKKGFPVIRNIEINIYENQDLQKLSLPELSEIAYELIKKSIKKKLSSNSKVGLMLSGGIDSAAIARVLYDLNIDATFITWTSSNNKADEGKYSEKISNYLGYELKKINVDSEVGLMPKIQAEYFPFTHAVSSWWEAACDIAKASGVEVLLSGHFAGSFDGDFALNNQKSLIFSLNDVMHAYANPLFADKLIGKKRGENKSKNRLNEDNVFRKIDIFTKEAKDSILDYINSHTFDDFSMQTQEYSYKLNLFDIYGINLCSPYLDVDIMDFCRALPENRKNCYCDGLNINKVVLRYCMLNKIPHDIVSRYYSANLGYMTQKNLIDFFKKTPNYFDTDSVLVEKGILDINKTRQIITSEKQIQSNGILSIVVLVEEWLRKVGTI